jgi:hypothetical protein
MYTRFVFLITFIICGVTLSIAQNDDARKMFMEAKQKCIDQKWHDAIDLFETLLQNYPSSRYRDDAKFWIAYSLEKIPESSIDAFFNFAELVKESPNSPWKDDAIMHQIKLAEEFVRAGQEQYRRFLREKMTFKMPQIRNRAAIALGRLGDPSALSVLNELRNDEDLGGLATNLITLLDKKPIKSLPDTSTADFHLYYDRGIQPIKPGKPDDRGFLWFNTQRYEQYRSMLRKDDDWTRQELVDFALWHIVDTDEFESYRTLSDAYDKEEWLRKFWKEKDPTPTTEQNELVDEFNRRVEFARANFGRFWNYKQFRYLPDQHMRRDWYHAPWDARGEVYIKYGEPYARSISGWHTEEWVYYNYGVDFIIKQYMTNIYGNALFAGPMSQMQYKDFNWPGPRPVLSFGSEFSDYNWYNYNSYIDANFIYNNEIRYQHDYDAEPIENFALGIENSILRYQIPAKEFSLEEIDNMYRLKYRERYVIYDEDYREVLSNETERTVEEIRDKDQLITQNIPLDLAPGIYSIAIRITDFNSNGLGIYKKKFEISP